MNLTSSEKLLEYNNDEEIIFTKSSHYHENAQHKICFGFYGILAAV